MIRGVFFDLFGTLFIYGDMKKAWADWLHYFHSSMQDCGLAMSKNEFSIACDRFFGKEEPISNDTDMTVFEKRINALGFDLNINLSKVNVSSIANLIVDKWQEQISLDADAIPTIQQLKKDKVIGLVSNFDHPPHVYRCLSKYDMSDLFDTITVSGEIGVKKPDPEIFNPALAETGMDPSEVVYVGDTEEDIAAARAANMKPIFIQRQDAGTDQTALDFLTENRKQARDGNRDANPISSLPELITLVG